MHTNTRTHAHTRTYTHSHTHHQAAAMHIFRHRSLVGDLVLVVLEHVIRFTPVKEEDDESEQQESTKVGLLNTGPNSIITGPHFSELPLKHVILQFKLLLLFHHILKH